MPTNLNLDDDLVERARALGGHASKRDAVNRALQEYVDQLGRLRAIEQLGTIEFDPDYDYKRDRRDRRSA